MLKVREVKGIYEMKGEGRSIRGIAQDLGHRPQHGSPVLEIPGIHEAQAPAAAGIESRPST